LTSGLVVAILLIKGKRLTNLNGGIKMKYYVMPKNGRPSAIAYGQIKIEDIKEA
jgi:hypothetical protein